uniref:BolA-like protein 2 n=1 Tax=Megaselia scalaris TaxID=36166 RepID=T1GYV4_MEGSC
MRQSLGNFWKTVIQRNLFLPSAKMQVYSEKHIETKITEKLENISYDQSDGCGGKFHVVIVSEKFKGKPLLQRHRLVNSALVEELKTIHAFSQKTYTPEEWEKEKGE